MEINLGKGRKLGFWLNDWVFQIEYFDTETWDEFVFNIDFLFWRRA